MYPIALKIGMYKGRLYGVTTGLNIWAVYYRVGHVLEAGLDPDKFPQTLEELSVWGEKLNRFDKNRTLLRLGFLPEWFAMLAPSFGGGFYDWKTGRLTLNTAENLRALEFLTGERNKLGYDNVVRFRSGLTTGFAAGWPFIGGAYSACIEGQWRVEQLAKYAPELDYRTAPIPPPAGGLKHAGWSNGNFMIIPKGAKHPEGAWEFVKFWSGIENPERAASLYIMGGWLPLTPAIAQAPAYQEYIRNHPQFQTFLDVLPSQNIQPTPPVPYQVYLWDRIGRADDAAVRGLLSPRQALERLERENQQEIARRREFGYDD
jgi:multiple sugar transport system substrate-binding protein